MHKGSENRVTIAVNSRAVCRIVNEITAASLCMDAEREY